MGHVYEVSEEEKGEWECLGNALADLAAIWAGGAVALGATGVGAAAAVGAGLASAAFWYLGNQADDVADDPPQPKFKKPVQINEFQPKLIRFRTSPLMPLVRATSSAFKVGSIGKGLLDAAERVQGANKAGDSEYVTIQSRMGLKLHRSTIRGVNKLAIHLRDTADSLKDTEPDVTVNHEHIKGLREQIRKGELPDYLKEALKRAGFTPGQKRQYCAWLRKLYIKKLWTTKLSYQCEVASNILERAAEALKR